MVKALRNFLFQTQLYAILLKRNFSGFAMFPKFAIFLHAQFLQDSQFYFQTRKFLFSQKQIFNFLPQNFVFFLHFSNRRITKHLAIVSDEGMHYQFLWFRFSFFIFRIECLPFCTRQTIRLTRCTHQVTRPPPPALNGIRSERCSQLSQPHFRPC